jgi:glycosyltransferase involved in cell wall biosynthesis
MKMRVIIIGPAYPYRGGIADTNESLARAFTKNGHDASVVTFKMQYPDFLFPGKTQLSEDLAPDQPKITRMINSINPINWILSARKIRRMHADLVIIRYWLPFMSPSLGTIARLIKKKITLLALCDNIIPHEKRPGDKLFTRYFVKPFDGFITMSSKVSDELDVFTKKKKIYIPHPINDNLGEKLAKSEARQYLNLEQDGKYVLFFGLVRKYKGLDLLFKSMSEALIKDSNIKLLVVGEFYDPIEDYERMIKEYGLQEKVIIINEYVPTSDIKYYFSASDLVAQTYHTASQSGISQIAYNFETPLLVTNVGGLPEMVEHDESGYVTSKDSKEIAAYISKFFAEEKYRHFSNTIKGEKEKYTWTSFAKTIVNKFMSR